MTTEDAKAYLANREIPQLFESLLTGLMFYRPEDHIAYLQECLKKIHSDGVEKVRWNLFIDSKRGKTPLPPITPENGRSKTPVGGRGNSFITDEDEDFNQDEKDEKRPYHRHNSTALYKEDGDTNSRKTSKTYDHPRELKRNETPDEGRRKVDSPRKRSVTSPSAVGIEERKSSYSGVQSPDILKLNSGRKTPDNQSRPNSGRVFGDRPTSARFDKRPSSGRRSSKSVDRQDSAKSLGEYDGKRNNSKSFDRQDSAKSLGEKSMGFNEKRRSSKSFDRQDSVKSHGDQAASGRSTPRRQFSRSNSLRSGRNTPADIEALTSPRDGPKSLEEKRGSPLPPIGAKATSGAAQATGSLKLPDCPIVLCMGGPGSGKATQCRQLIDRYSGWVHLSMGDLLRSSIMDKGSVDEKWGMVASLVNKGELAPDEMTADLIKENIQKNMSAKGIIIEGYPRTMEQVKEFTQLIGRVDLAFVLDCEEQYLEARLAHRQKATGRIDDSESAVEERIKFFREKTLPAIKHFDDMGKLAVVDGDRDVAEIFYDLATIFEHVFRDQLAGGSSSQPAAAAGADSKAATAPRPPSSPRPKASSRPSSSKYKRAGSAEKGGKSSSPRPGSGFSRVATMVDIKVKDEGRKLKNTNAPIMFVMGGPGSGKKRYGQQLAEKMDGYVYISSGDALRASDAARDAIMAGNLAPLEIAALAVQEAFEERVSSSTQGVILEGFPRNQEQLEFFNREVGGLTYAILVDVGEDFMKKNIDMARNDANAEAIDRRVRYFKHETLPILAHLDDHNCLMVVDGERPSDAVFGDILAMVETQHNHNKAMESLINQRPPSVCLDPPDNGRVDSGIIKCPFFAVVGSPGAKVQNYVQKIAEKYPKYGCVNMLGKKMSDLEAALPKHADADGLIIDSFPMDQASVYDFNTKIGGLNLVIVLDCEEDFAKQNSSSLEVNLYKQNTLSMLGYYDDRNRLEVVDVQKLSEDEVVAACCKAIDNIHTRPRFRGFDNKIDVIDVRVEDSGRKSDLPKCPVISVISGPQGGADKICKRLAEKNAGSLHVDASNLSADEIIAKLSNDAPVVFLEGFPNSKQTLEQFNQKVGGMSRVIVLDSSAEFCAEKGATEADLDRYRDYAIPVLGHYDDYKRLDIVNGERSEDDVFETVSNCVQKALSKQST